MIHKISIASQIAEIDRELEQRRKVYPRLVATRSSPAPAPASSRALIHAVTIANLFVAQPMPPADEQQTPYRSEA